MISPCTDHSKRYRKDKKKQIIRTTIPLYPIAQRSDNKNKVARNRGKREDVVPRTIGLGRSSISADLRRTERKKLWLEQKDRHVRRSPSRSVVGTVTVAVFPQFRGLVVDATLYPRARPSPSHTASVSCITVYVAWGPYSDTIRRSPAVSTHFSTAHDLRTPPCRRRGAGPTFSFRLWRIRIKWAHSRIVDFKLKTIF